jgi:L-seryl-tRNA(Ser) seleniumtransferase
LIEDVGSGCLLDTAAYGLDHEPTLGESLDAGVDLVCASGDKLLGGPQAGIVLGRSSVVESLRRHPLARALRADKSCLAGLTATLQHYLRGDATESVPVWWMISRAEDWLRQRVEGWQAALPSADVRVIATKAMIGGGSLPEQSLPSYALSYAHAEVDAETLARRLRTGSPCVYPRIVDDRMLIDARTVLDGQDEALLAALRTVLDR